MLRACTMKTISRCGCSMIAATATDHIGAKPVPLATSTMRPAWPVPEKGAAKRSHQLDAVPGTDFLAERRGNQSVGHLADVKVQQVIVGRAFQRKGRAVGPCRKSLKLQLAILAGKDS